MSEDNNVVSNTETNPTNDNTVKGQKTKKKKIIPICLGILVVLCLGFGGFIFYQSKPKRIVANVINEAYANYDKAVNKTLDFDPLKDSYIIKGNLAIDTNIDGLEDLSKDKFGFTVGMDYPNKKIEAGGVITENSKKLIDAMIYIIKDTGYVSLGDDYKKLINLGSDADVAEVFELDEIEELNISKDDINYIVKAYKDILIDSIDEDDLEKSSDTIKIDGESTKVTKITYKLNNKTLTKLYKKIVDGTLEDKELLKKLSGLTGVDVDDLKDELKDSKKEIDFGDVKATLNFYTKGITNKYVGLELKGEGFSLKAIKIDDEKTDITLDIESLANVEINIKENSDEKFSADYKVKVAGEEVSGSVKATSKETKKDKYEGTFAFSIKYEDQKFALDMDYSIELNANVANIDTKNTVDADDPEVEEALEKIAEKFEKSDLYTLIESVSEGLENSMFGANNYTYDYDYDYDYDYNF